MWSENALSERLGIEWPIFQAPMAEMTTPRLAAAVSSAGGVGALGMWGFSADAVAARIDGFRQIGKGPLNVNYPLWRDPGDLSQAGKPMRARLQALYDEKGLGPVPQPSATGSVVDPVHLDVLVDSGPEIVSFHFGLPDATILERLKQAGICILCSATTVAEAKILESEGVDVIIAQGLEAGGHRGTFSGVGVDRQSGLLSLLPQVVDAVDLPVIAAGGIADGRGIAAAMMLGASGVLLGTAFLRCAEAAVSDGYRAALADAGEASTRVTDRISGRNARFISNRLVDELIAFDAEPLPFPAQYGLTQPLGDGDDREFADLLAGQSVALTREMPAAELLRTLAEETTRRIEAFAR